MAPLVETIIRAVTARTDGDLVREALVDAAFLFEKARGISPAGWSQEVIDTEITAADVAELKRAVVAFVQRGGFGSWTLGKCCDPAMRPVLVGVLRRHVDGNARELFQAMIALDHLGEDVLAGASSMSFNNEVENGELARAYLRRLTAR